MEGLELEWCALLSWFWISCSWPVLHPTGQPVHSGDWLKPANCPTQSICPSPATFPQCFPTFFLLKHAGIGAVKTADVVKTIVYKWIKLWEIKMNVTAHIPTLVLCNKTWRCHMFKTNSSKNSMALCAHIKDCDKWKMFMNNNVMEKLSLIQKTWVTLSVTF